ncbi:MAG: hypothetical protein ACLQFW_11225 [Xanthobacteraceae bacterium]
MPQNFVHSTLQIASLDEAHEIESNFAQSEKFRIATTEILRTRAECERDDRVTNNAARTRAEKKLRK